MERVVDGGGHAHCAEALTQVVCQGGVDGRGLLSHWMNKVYAVCVQGESGEVVVVAEGVIEVAAAIIGVANQGVVQMPQVASNLMGAPRLWCHVDQ